MKTLYMHRTNYFECRTPKKNNYFECRIQIIQKWSRTTTTEMISRDASFFSKGGCKCTPLLQQELSTVAIGPPLEMHLQRRVTEPSAPENMAPFQRRVVPSRAPKDAIFKGGWCRQPPLEMRPVFRGGRWHQPPLENHF
jgi:hypothetical protein